MLLRPATYFSGLPVFLAHLTLCAPFFFLPEHSIPISATGPLLCSSLTLDSCLHSWLLLVTASTERPTFFMMPHLASPCHSRSHYTISFFLFFSSLFNIFVFHRALLSRSVFIPKTKSKLAFALLLHGCCFIFFIAHISL